MKRKNYLIGFSLWGIITAAVTVMNMTRFSYRLFFFPALLVLLPFLVDRSLSLYEMVKPTKNGLKLFAFFALLILFAYPPLYYGWMTIVEHRIFSLPEMESIGKALNKGFLLLLVASIPEEVFFRGYLQHSVFKNRSKLLIPLISQRNLIVSALFALTHAIAFMNPLRLNVFFPSLLFGFIVERSKGSLFYAILMHAVANFLAMLLGTFF
ncbi:CPBP family intramembrane metalloprotease [bacterium]|nr:CPBP family intramembrane metalloprotease [bacterium]